MGSSFEEECYKSRRSDSAIEGKEENDNVSYSSVLWNRNVASNDTTEPSPRRTVSFDLEATQTIPTNVMLDLELRKVLWYCPSEYKAIKAHVEETADRISKGYQETKVDGVPSLLLPGSSFCYRGLERMAPDSAQTESVFESKELVIVNQYELAPEDLACLYIETTWVCRVAARDRALQDEQVAQKIFGAFVQKDNDSSGGGSPLLMPLLRKTRKAFGKQKQRILHRMSSTGVPLLRSTSASAPPTTTRATITTRRTTSPPRSFARPTRVRRHVSA